MSGDLLWHPSAEAVEKSQLTAFARRVAGAHGVAAEDYADLHRWSVEEPEAFWRELWDHFDVQADGAADTVLASREMPGAEWFPGTSLNYAEHVFAGKPDERVAILHASETRALDEVTWGELRHQVAAVAGGLRSGSRPGEGGQPGLARQPRSARLLRRPGSRAADRAARMSAICGGRLLLTAQLFFMPIYGA